MNNKESKDCLRNYKFIKTIGEGTFGKVKLSIHLLTNEYVAIKILEKSRIIDKEDLERVEKEIKYLKLFDHPNIIQIYEVIETTQNFYIVTEYVPCGELFNYIVNKERIDEKEASFFYSQIIHGLNEINKKKICHRDIKPENLLLTKKKIIKIIDFGLSNEYVDTLDTQCGSPCYAAPEIIRGMKYNGLMVDIWASGIILFAMLFGYLPFDDKDNNILFRKILECNLEFPNDIEVSDEAKDLISRILTPNPNKRIKLEEILVHPFLKSGNIQYHKMVKPQRINNDDIIINYMVNVLKYSNVDNSIRKLVKANKHDGCTTTYKLLKKQILEGSFNYNLYNSKMVHILPYVSPIKNIKVKNNYLLDTKNEVNQIKNMKTISNHKRHVHNINVINKTMNLTNDDTDRKNYIQTTRRKEAEKLRKSLKETNHRMQTHSTDNSKISKKTEDLSIGKKKKIDNNIDISNFERINKNNLLFRNLKIKLLYSRILFPKNKNNFVKNIDTSISVDKNRIKKYHKKAVSITPSKRPINPFIYDNNLHKYDNSKRKKVIYFPNYLLKKNRGKSDDKTNKNTKFRYTKTPVLNIYLDKYKNRYILSPINPLKYVKYNALSMDKPNKMKIKNKKNNINIKTNLYAMKYKDDQYKNHNSILNTDINIYNNEKRQKSPCFRNITVLDNNKYNNLSKKSTIEKKNEISINAYNPRKRNNYICYKYNNYNTIQTNPNNSNNNPICINNTNIVYNYQINNGSNRNNRNIKEVNKEIKNDKKTILKLNKNIYNNKYIPLKKHKLKESQELKICNDKFRTISTAEESSSHRQNLKLTNKKHEIKKIYIGNKNSNHGTQDDK